MQQRRHVSALFYGAILRSSMVTKEEIQQTVAYTTNFFIGLNMQQRRHVSALFYAAIFRSSMVVDLDLHTFLISELDGIR